MKFAVNIFLISCLLLLVSACGNSDSPESTENSSTLPPLQVTINDFKSLQNINTEKAYSHEANATVLSANIKLGLKHLSSTTDSDTVISPILLSRSLATLLVGAKGDTYQQVLSDLEIDMESTILNFQPDELMNALVDLSNKQHMPIKTTTWGKHDFQFATEYLVKMGYFNSELNSINISSEPDDKNSITNWLLSQNFQSNINQLIESINTVNLVTAVAHSHTFRLSASWDNNEYIVNSVQANFGYLNYDGYENQAVVPMKEISGDIPYYSNDRYEAFELSLFNSPIKLMIIMPFYGQLGSTIHQFSEVEFDHIDKNFFTNARTVYLPVFSIDRYGSNHYKENSTDDFSGINIDGLLYLKQLGHYTYFSVNEEGLQGESIEYSLINSPQLNSDLIVLYPSPDIYTDIYTEGGMSGSISNFGWDPQKECYPPEQARPFIFILRDTTDNSILSIGKISDDTIGGERVEPTLVSIYDDCP